MPLAEIMKTAQFLLQNYSIADSGRNKLNFRTRCLREFSACKADVGRTRLFLLQSKSRELPRGSPHACGFERLSKRYADSGQKNITFYNDYLLEFGARRRVRRKKAPGIRKKIPGVVL